MALANKPEYRATKSAEQIRVRIWIEKHYGLLTTIAKDLGLSIAFVQRIAYGRDAKSRDYRVERRLQQQGWPLANKILAGVDLPD